jgi:DNA-binding NarL/FixJ family response regulator
MEKIKVPCDLRGFDKLTPNEYNVARLYARGLAAREIASLMCRSVKTTETHMRNAWVKLGIHGTPEFRTCCALYFCEIVQRPAL